MKQLLVTAAIIEKDGRYLITQRVTGHRTGRWEFPGGKVEVGENPRDGLKREIKEELDIDIEVGEIFEVSSHVYEDDDKHVILMAFYCDYVGGEIKKKEIGDYKWLEPEEMDNYNITEADLPFVEKLKR